MIDNDVSVIDELQQRLKPGNHIRVKSTIKKLLTGDFHSETLLNACYVLLKNERLFQADALKLLGKSLAKKPDNAEKVLWLINELGLRDDELFSEKLFKLALSHAPRSLALNSDLGAFYTYHKKFEQAEIVFLIALKCLGTNARLLINLSNLYVEMKKIHEARACAQLAVEADPSADIAASVNLAAFAQTSGDYQKASNRYLDEAVVSRQRTKNVRFVKNWADILGSR